MCINNEDEKWMRRAMALAEQAAAEGEVPVGALVVLNGEVIGEGYNRPIGSHDPTAHAEVQALRQAAAHLENYRLVEATLYVTLEPCTMCAGAMVHARVKRLVYGAAEPKAGVVESQGQLLQAPYLNHQIEVTGGVLAELCSQQLSAFFKLRRDEKKRLKQAQQAAQQ
ncbi:tRNA adenosine(34) deaminase TadA [Pokkaliibacter sp. CJK22405]|uniref:tRNA adenosine(34) deaminase TadA n=1 Tax=Pokkaliibacter sp. CJK22405 TaxID=3384615 RepID=UPI003984A0AA